MDIPKVKKEKMEPRTMIASIRPSSGSPSFF